MKTSRKKIASLTSTPLLALLDNSYTFVILITMNINEQTDTFQYELAKLVYRFKSEYDLNDYTIAGCLDFCKLSVLTETDDVIFTGELTEDTDNEEDTDTDDIQPHF
jgi:hypothetical protein